jgi:hypothetical protein
MADDDYGDEQEQQKIPDPEPSGKRIFLPCVDIAYKACSKFRPVFFVMASHCS